MSIVICIKVGEGLVLAADSVTTLQGASPDGRVAVLNTYEHARKLSHIGDLPIGSLTWGSEFIGKRNIESLLSEYENRMLSQTYDDEEKIKPYKLKDIVQEIFQFMSQRYEEAYGTIAPEKKPPVGMLIAGYSYDEFFPEEYRFVFPMHNAPERIRPDANGKPVYGATWQGQVDAIQRLYKGYDAGLRQVLVDKGIDATIVEELPKDLTRLEWPIIYDGMPLQDAIDLAQYLIEVVIGRFRFLPGPATCGGRIDIAVITHKGFIWVRRKNWK
jgi:hypothetical protein